jgi:hypothetical protein
VLRFSPNWRRHRFATTRCVGRGFRFFRILNKSPPPCFAIAQPGGSIVMATAQNNTHNPRAVGPSAAEMNSGSAAGPVWWTFGS